MTDDVLTPGLRRLCRCRRLLVRVCGAVVLLAVLVCSGCCLLYRGPYQTPELLPQGRLIDMHCHVAGIGAGGSGCFVSPELEKSYKFSCYLKSFGVTREEIRREGDALLVRRVSEQLAQSRHVGAAVILAMDGVIDSRGQLDHTRTEVYVPNEFVAEQTARHPNLIFGASVNPNRTDALERLDWASAHGAQLVKWLPAIMDIDPADERFIPFYRKLVALHLPLLTHTGQERSFTHSNDAYGDPERLRLPLRLGVTVIAAHIASTGSTEGDRDTDRLLRIMPDYPNLYSDISSLTQINKPGYLREALQDPRFAGRLLYGSDFPLINTPVVSPYYFPLNLRFRQMRSIAAIRNPWDRDVALKQALGVPASLFERSSRFFKARREKHTD